jgi:hypothetical protein
MNLLDIRQNSVNGVIDLSQALCIHRLTRAYCGQNSKTRLHCWSECTPCTSIVLSNSTFVISTPEYYTRRKVKRSIFGRDSDFPLLAACPDGLWGPTIPLSNGYQKEEVPRRPEREADQSSFHDYVVILQLKADVEFRLLFIVDIIQTETCPRAPLTTINPSWSALARTWASAVTSRSQSASTIVRPCY